MNQHILPATEKGISIWGCSHCSRPNILGKVIIPLYMTFVSPRLVTVRSLGLSLQENLSTI